MYSPPVNTHHSRHLLPLLTEYLLRLITSKEILQFFARHRAPKYWHDMYGCNHSRFHGSQHILILLLSRMVLVIVTITYCYRLWVIIELYLPLWKNEISLVDCDTPFASLALSINSSLPTRKYVRDVFLNLSRNHKLSEPLGLQLCLSIIPLELPLDHVPFVNTITQMAKIPKILEVFPYCKQECRKIPIPTLWVFSSHSL